MYTDNVLNADPSHYPTPRSWFLESARAAAARSRLPPDREDIKVLEQMVCNDLVDPASGVSQLVKGLRSVRESGAHWLSVFANDLLEVAPTPRHSVVPASAAQTLPQTVIAPPTAIQPAAVAVPPPAHAAEVPHSAIANEIEEVLMDEWPVAELRSGEDQHYRTVDALAVGASLLITRDDGRQMPWRVEQRCPKTLSFTLVDASGNRRLTRTRSGLAAELRRGACQLVVEQPRPSGLLARLVGVLGL